MFTPTHNRIINIPQFSKYIYFIIFTLQHFRSSDKRTSNGTLRINVSPTPRRRTILLVNISTLAARQTLNVFHRLLLAFIFHSIKVFREHVFDCVLNAPPGFCSWMKILVKCFFVRHGISIDSFFYHRVEERLKHQQRRSQDKIRSAKKSMKSKIVQQHQLHQRPTNRRGENPKKERTKEYSSLFTMP